MTDDDRLGALGGVLGFEPGDPRLYREALTHGSGGEDDYQRLEFLGDRVLGLCVAELLYARFPNEAEGHLSHRLNALVSGETCAEIARENDLGRFVILGKQARDDGGRDSANILGDIVESLIGALFLDRGIDAARSFVARLWGDRVQAQHAAPRHPKSALQEWAAAHRRKTPQYRVVDRSGPPHAPRFTVAVEIAGIDAASGEGSSKQEAERAAAQALLDSLDPAVTS